VHAKPPFGGPEYVLQYLGPYASRVAISNHRLVSFTEGKVTFRWRDSAHHNEQKLLTLSIDEFLRRFLLHVLPKGFVRIRNFGFLANRRRATLLPLCVHLLGSAPQTEQDLAGCKDSSDFWLCPKYGGPMWSSKDSLPPRPTSLSSGPGHCCRMKQLTTARILSAYKFAQSLCALPFHKPRLSTFSSYFFARILHLPHPFLPHCRLRCSLTQSRQTCAPNLPTIEFA